MVCFLGMGNIVPVSLNLFFFFILVVNFRWKSTQTMWSYTASLALGAERCVPKLKEV